MAEVPLVVNDGPQYGRRSGATRPKPRLCVAACNIPLVNNHDCAHAFEEGWILMRRPIYWSPAARIGWFRRLILLTPEIGGRQYRTRPVQHAGERCSMCETYRMAGTHRCEHVFEDGRSFHFAKLLWWSGKERYKPGFWYPFDPRDTGGRRPEVIYAPPLIIVSPSRARCRTGRCHYCGALEFRPCNKKTSQ
jgi:hypothetical protein